MHQRRAVAPGVVTPFTTVAMEDTKKNNESSFSTCKTIITLFIGVVVGVLCALTIAGWVALNRPSQLDKLKYLRNLTIWNTAVIMRPDANPRAIPPPDKNWGKNVENLLASKVREADRIVVGGRGESGGNPEIYVPFDLSKQQSECQPLKETPEEFMFSSQDGQDQMVSYILNGKTHGFFVEFGAGDGSFHSNTKFFEKQLCWTGMLFLFLFLLAVLIDCVGVCLFD